MKKLIFTISAVLLLGTLSAQTSQTEYNYVTKGYKVQQESGLDMKKGYEIKDVDYIKQAGANGSIEREVWLKALNRISENGVKTIAAYMVVYHRIGKDQEYLCIPAPNSAKEIIDAYYTSLYPDNSDHSSR